LNVGEQRRADIEKRPPVLRHPSRRGIPIDYLDQRNIDYLDRSHQQGTKSDERDLGNRCESCRF
jgi:hypothetical protein